MANYVCTFIDQTYIDNILKVWLPSLKRNFSGKIVIITIGLNQNYIEELKKQDVIIIEIEEKIKGIHRLVEKRLKYQEQFIQTLNDSDKIMLIDGADVVFQSEINTFFDTIQNKIYYSTVKELTNETTFKWINKLLKNNNEKDNFLNKLYNETIKAVGMLAGTKKTFEEYFINHNKFIEECHSKYFLGINQAVLTCLILKYPENFQETDIHNCRLSDKDIILKDGIFKIEKTIPIIHFSCPSMKQTYNELYIDNSIKELNNDKKLKILWLYGSINKWDDINHWYHLDFAKVLKNQPNINLLVYGYKLNQVRPDLATIPYNENIIGKDLKSIFDFDVIIMDNKNRFYKNPANRETLWLKPEFFYGLDNIPKIMLEGDYHLHFKHPNEKNWYKDRKIDLLLVRHLSSLLYHDNDIPIKWFPCSVDNTVFKPNPNIIREPKICLIGGYGLSFYIYRNKIGKILESTELSKIYNGRLLNEKYIECLQSYMSHISCSSTRYITASKMFEIMASGSVLFTDEGTEYGLTELFPEGSYCTYKRDGADAIEQATKIIHDIDFRNSIITKGLEVIQQKHTHIVRAKELLQIITKEFGISYKINENNDLGLIEKICKFFSKPIEVTTDIPENIVTIPNKESTVLSQPIIEKDKELENLTILKKLNKKNIEICLLKDTCYNIILNNKIGNTLHIAVNNTNIAKKLIGNEINFQEFPKETKQFEFENMIFYVPYPIMNYLKSEYGLKAEIEFSKKKEILKLIKKNTYEFCKRKKRKKR